MSTKWTSDDEAMSADGIGSPRILSSPPSEQKIGSGGGSGRRPRRSRPGDSPAKPSNGGKEDPPIRTMAGGWGLDAEGSTTTAAESKSSVGAMETSTRRGSNGAGVRAARRNHFDDETEILIIPDLEDEGEEDVETKIAVAPTNTTRRVPSLRELDDDLKYSVPYVADGIDMSLLTKTLVPPEMLEEDDSPWDFEGLLQTVTQEFNATKRSSHSQSRDYGGVDDTTEGASNTLRANRGVEFQRSSRSSRALVA